MDVMLALIAPSYGIQTAPSDAPTPEKGPTEAYGGRLRPNKAKPGLIEQDGLEF